MAIIDDCLGQDVSEEGELETSCRHDESGFYWIDEEHDGKIWLTTLLIDKYNLNINDLFSKTEHLEEKLEDWGKGEDYDLEVASLEDYSHYIYIQYCTHVTGKKEDFDNIENWIEETTHGSLHSNELLAWLNNFPVQILSEPGVTIS